MRLHVLTLLIGCFTLPTLAQFTFEQTDTIPVTGFRFRPLDQPWVGGINQALYLPIDLNLDGEKDLAIYDRGSQKWIPFLYTDGQSSLAYTFAPEYQFDFPPVSAWVLAADFDRDGLNDLFVYQSGGIVLYRNVSNDLGYLAFEPYHDLAPLSSTLTTVPEPIAITPIDLPAITDFDLDGDLDILHFTEAGNFIYYHKNQQVELSLPVDSFAFFLEEGCWGHVEENDLTADFSLDVFCKSNGTNAGTSGGNHAGSTLLVFDSDGDGDKDALVGDVFTEFMIYLQNGDSPTHAYIDSQSTKFPTAFPVLLREFPAASWLDVNHDGREDLLISPFSTGDSQDKESSWYYRTSGPVDDPRLSFITNDFLQVDMLDVGTQARPLLVDYNQDGLQDLFIANLGDFTTFDTTYRYYPSISLYRNVGTQEKARFARETTDLGDFYGKSAYLGGIHIALADLDEDQDLDMMVGKVNGQLDYYENTSASPTTFLPDFTLTTSSFQNIDVSSFASPTFADVDHDGKQDLLIGNRQGTIHYYRNTSTSGNVSFELVTQMFAGVQTASPLTNEGFSTLSWWEDTSGIYLFVGTGTGELLVYTNLDTTTYTAATLTDTLSKGLMTGTHFAPTLGKLNGDDLPDIILGNTSGGMNLFMGTSRKPIPVGISAAVPSLPFKVFPNPATEQVTIRWSAFPHQEVRIQLFDLKGSQVLAQTLSPNQTQLLDVSDLSPGLYVMWINGWNQQPFYTKLRVD